MRISRSWAWLGRTVAVDTAVTDIPSETAGIPSAILFKVFGRGMRSLLSQVVAYGILHFLSKAWCDALGSLPKLWKRGCFSSAWAGQAWFNWWAAVAVLLVLWIRSVLCANGAGKQMEWVYVSILGQSLCLIDRGGVDSAGFDYSKLAVLHQFCALMVSMRCAPKLMAYVQEKTN